MSQIKRRDFLKLVAASAVGALVPLPKSRAIVGHGAKWFINGKPVDAFPGITDFESARRQGNRVLFKTIIPRKNGKTLMLAAIMEHEMLS